MRNLNQTQMRNKFKDYMLEENNERIGKDRIVVDLKNHQIMVLYNDYKKYYYIAKSGKFLEDYYIRYKAKEIFE